MTCATEGCDYEAGAVCGYAGCPGRKLRVLDLFAGIGGFSLGLERTGGFETAAFCEREPYPRQILAQWWPEVPCYDDVCTLTAERLAADGIAVDVITGGFPCQDISFAGKGAGLAGERSGLFYEVARLIGELAPRFVILENVSALLSRGLDAVLGTLASLGYDAEWHCIPASYLGAPHRRDRIWIIAYPEGQQSASILAGAGLEEQRQPGGVGFKAWAVWPPVSLVLGVDDGFPDALAANKALGNAVVPQIPELIGRAILAATQDLRRSPPGVRKGVGISRPAPTSFDLAQIHAPAHSEFGA